MKAITEYTLEEAAEMSGKYKALADKVKGTTDKDWFSDYKRTSGYAHYKFSGTVTDKLVELLGGHLPNPTEIILLVDSGFSHFGATCSFDGKRFSGKVNTD